MLYFVKWLKLPEIKNIYNKDDYSITLLHRKIIQKKPFLKKLYIDFYNQFKKSISGSLNTKLLVELGSGGSFIKDIIPNMITSDIINLPNVDKTFSVLNMPFENNTIDAFFMFDVLHHIENALILFKELNRCLKVNGKIIMIEPASTLWGRFIYRYLHHEPYDSSKGWYFEKGSPLFSANTALPWIIFYRDRCQFEKEFPSFRILRLEPHTPFRFLISGGVYGRQLLPSFTYNIIRGIEIILSPLNKYFGIYLTIEIEKKL